MNKFGRAGLVVFLGYITFALLKIANVPPTNFKIWLLMVAAIFIVFGGDE